VAAVAGSETYSQLINSNDQGAQSAEHGRIREPPIGSVVPGGASLPRGGAGFTPSICSTLSGLGALGISGRALAACYADMGWLDEAREIVRRLRAITPAVMEPATRYRNPELRELFLSGVRLATGEEGHTDDQ